MKKTVLSILTKNGRYYLQDLEKAKNPTYSCGQNCGGNCSVIDYEKSGWVKGVANALPVDDAQAQFIVNMLNVTLRIDTFIVPEKETKNG